jgi:hypothetical protein
VTDGKKIIAQIMFFKVRIENLILMNHSKLKLTSFAPEKQYGYDMGPSRVVPRVRPTTTRQKAYQKKGLFVVLFSVPQPE